MTTPIEDADTGREHITEPDEKCWCNPEVITVEAAKTTGVDETAMAVESEEGRQWRLQRRYDQAELIEWILHYKNPADDDTKLRQIRLVLE